MASVEDSPEDYPKKKEGVESHHRARGHVIELHMVPKSDSTRERCSSASSNPSVGVSACFLDMFTKNSAFNFQSIGNLVESWL